LASPLSRSRRFSLVFAILQFAARSFRPLWRGPSVTFRIHHLGLYSIQMLANPATIIYWNHGDGEKVTGKKGLSDGFQIVVIF
jgi:hypothetical protein